MAVKCINCGGAHPSWDCSKPTKSTAARKDVHPLTGDAGKPGALTNAGSQDSRKEGATLSVAGTQALPVDTPHKPKMGRPRTGYIKAEYNRQYSADQRTIKRLGLNCTVKEWREKNGGE